MISKRSIQNLIERMQKSISSNNLSRLELESLAADVILTVDSLNLQIKRCASWIDSGRFVEAAALSKDCDNLVLLSDKLCNPRALPAWDEYCSKNTLDKPSAINKDEVNLLNTAGGWGKTVDTLTSNWVESNILQHSITDRWSNLKKLEKHDDQNPIWEEQVELLSNSVLHIFVEEFEQSRMDRDLDTMKIILRSVESTTLCHSRKKEEQRMADEIVRLTSEMASEQLAEIAERIAEVACEGDFDKQRILLSKWEECLAKGGKCPERQHEIDEVTQSLKIEDELKEVERIEKNRITELEHLLDSKAPCHDIEVLYYEIKEKHTTDIPENLEERVRYVINEEKAIRRRKTRIISTTIFAIVAIAGTLITISVLKTNRNERIAGYVHLGEACLENLDFNCYEDWFNEVKDLHFDKLPSIQTVISKKEAAINEERVLRADAENAFLFADTVVLNDRPDISDFTTCKKQMEIIIKLPLNDLSERAIINLQSLTEKEVKLRFDDTKSLEEAIDITHSNVNNLHDPSLKKKDKISPKAWNDAANERDTIKNTLYAAIDKYRFANEGMKSRAKNTIESLKSEISKMSLRAESIELCNKSFNILVTSVPQNSMQWANRIEDLLEHKHTAITNREIPSLYWTDLDSSAKTSKAIQHWRDVTFPYIKSFWKGEPWIDNMITTPDATDLKAKLEHHLQLHPESPYSGAVEEMKLVISNQISNNASTLISEIYAFSDLYKINLNAGRYYFGKGSNQPEDHGISEDNDVNQNPALLVPVSIGSASSVQNIPRLTNLSKSLDQFIQSNDLSTVSGIKQVLLALKALKICKTSDRIENPILSFAACNHISRQLLLDRGQILRVLSPDFYKKLKAWESNASIRLLTWPRSGLNSDESIRIHNRKDTEKLVSSLPDSELGINELDKNWELLKSSLYSASIQGIIKPTNSSYDIIGNSDPNAFVLINSNGIWEFSPLTITGDDTVIIDGIIASSPSLIFLRQSEYNYE